MSLKLIKEVVNVYGDSNNLMHTRFLLICILDFAGVIISVRELLLIKIKHIFQLDNHLEIAIPKSKTDQLRERHVVYVAGTGNRTCPNFG